jgi:hypothetical protein
MQRSAAGVAAASAGLYAALHSLLASDEAQAVARRVFGPVADRWYRLAYNALAVGLLVAQERLLARLPGRTVYALPGVGRVFRLFVRFRVSDGRSVAPLSSLPPTARVMPPHERFWRTPVRQRCLKDGPPDEPGRRSSPNHGT